MISSKTLVVLVPLAFLLLLVIFWVNTNDQQAQPADGAQNLPSGDYYGKWTPDGEQVVFYSWRDGNPNVYIMNRDGANPVRLTDHPDWETNLDVSPDGTRLAISARRNGQYDIIIMNLDGSEPVQITNTSDQHELAPSWSPDSRQLAFFMSATNGGRPQIAIMNADGSGIQNISNNEFVDMYPAWSPDGSKIAFASTRFGVRDVYVMDRDGANVSNVTRNPSFDSLPAWSPDGATLAFTSNRGTDEDDYTNIFTIGLDGENLQQLTHLNASDDRAPAWSPDGTMLLFDSTREGESGLFLMKRDGSDPHLVGSSHSAR